MTKKLLLLTTLFLAFACSKDDESGETFLSKHDGVGFVYNHEGGTSRQYIYFFNDQTFMRMLVEVYDEIDGCTFYEEGENYIGVNVDVEILTNDSETLVVGFSETYNGPDTMTFYLNESGNLIYMEGESRRWGTDVSYIRTEIPYSSMELGNCGPESWY